MAETRTYGPYKVIRELSIGGMGQLYLATKKGPFGFTKTFAVKVMRKDTMDDKKEIKRFVREAMIASRFEHPNVVPVIDFGEDNGRYYIAMPHIDGLNLIRLMNVLLKSGHVLPYEASALIILEAARALNYMHRLCSKDGMHLRLVHRDISPENIIVSKEGTTFLVDFGLVKYQGAEHLTNVGKVRGKLSYMAPERMIGDDADPKSDQFALGLVLHELLVGKRYFSTKMDKKLVQKKILQEGIIAPRDIQPDVPAALSDIVAKATAKKPMHRFRSLNEMEQAIHKYLYKHHPSFVGNDTLREIMSLIYAGPFMTIPKVDVEKLSQICRKRASKSSAKKKGGGSLMDKLKRPVVEFLEYAMDPIHTTDI